MFTMKLADLVISVENKYNYVENMCADYVVDNGNADFVVSADLNEIMAEQTGDFGLDYLESLAVCRKIAEKILDYDGILMHGVLMEYQDRGILICAKSGVGKTTHAQLWCELLGEACVIINGDKPLVRIVGNEIIAYGTPWAGKEGFNVNKVTKLTDICFLERAVDNRVEILKEDVIKSFFAQMYVPKNHKIGMALDLMGFFVKNTRQWKIYCNKELSAAELVKNTLWNDLIL